ncbi:MAG: recombination protein NinG [Azonexus sp.]
MPRCRHCSTLYKPARPMQPGRVCNSIECQAKHAEKNIASQRKKRAQAERVAKAEDRKVIKAKLLDMEPKSYWWKIAKRWFHLWVRTRDEGKECISCDTILIKTGKVGGDYDAGHRRSVGSAKHLEFDERNVHGQCKYCNDRLTGNPDGYNAKLPGRIGQEAYDALMADQMPRNLSADDYKQIADRYKKLLKELKK